MEAFPEGESASIEHKLDAADRVGAVLIAGRPRAVVQVAVGVLVSSGCRSGDIRC